MTKSLEWRKVIIYCRVGVHLEITWATILKDLTPPWCVGYRLQYIMVRGSESCRELIGQQWDKDNKSFILVLRIALRSALMSLYLVSGKAARSSFYLRAQELRKNLGQDVICSLPEPQTLWPLVRPRLLFSATFRVVGYVGERLGLWGRTWEKEKWFLKLKWQMKIMRQLGFMNRHLQRRKTYFLWISEGPWLSLKIKLAKTNEQNQRIQSSLNLYIDTGRFTRE